MDFLLTGGGGMAARIKTKEGHIKFAETLIAVSVRLYEGAFIGLVA